MTFPLSKKEWYLLRDDRTGRMCNAFGFEDYKVGVIVSNEVVSDFQCQVMAWLLSNILARWCRCITFQIPEHVVSKLNILKGNDFRNSIEEALLQVDPYIKLKFDSVDENKVNAICVIGNQIERIFKRAIWIDCDRWLAGIGTYPRKRYFRKEDSKNILGASFAACLGCSELFRQAIGDKSLQKENWFSLWDFKKSSNKDELKNYTYINNWMFGHAHQPGCGAVGSSFNYLLALTEWSGSIDLIDFDNIEYSNCNRSLPFTAYQAVNKIPKVEACGDILNFNPRISSRKFFSDYSQYIEVGNFLKPPPDLILCLANQKDIWRVIQSNLPPIVFHATTTTNWGVNFGRHIPKKEWCIFCRFSEEVKLTDQSNTECGKGIIVEKNNSEPILGVLPFLSPMSALLILTEMAKMAFSKKYPVNFDFVEFSFKKPEGIFLNSTGKIKKCCNCRSQETETYLEPIKKTKYWYLVNN